MWAATSADTQTENKTIVPLRSADTGPVRMQLYIETTDIPE